MNWKRIKPIKDIADWFKTLDWYYQAILGNIPTILAWLPGKAALEKLSPLAASAAPWIIVVVVVGYSRYEGREIRAKIKRYRLARGILSRTYLKMRI